MKFSLPLEAHLLRPDESRTDASEQVIIYVTYIVKLK